MKLNTTITNRRGIAMTEYLVILAIVAVGAILATGLFGKQVKSVFARTNQALVGVEQAADTTTASASVTEAGVKYDMGNFNNAAK